jgi:hypothetical protein
MAQGYWGPRAYGCVDCHSGPKEKFWCQPCDHVCKAPLGWDPHCPYCRQPMLNMGHRWRPGKRGKRTLAHSNQDRVAYRSAGELLLKEWDTRNGQDQARGGPAWRRRTPW